MKLSGNMIIIPLSKPTGSIREFTFYYVGNSWPIPSVFVVLASSLFEATHSFLESDEINAGEEAILKIEIRFGEKGGDQS